MFRLNKWKIFEKNVYTTIRESHVRKCQYVMLNGTISVFLYRYMRTSCVVNCIYIINIITIEREKRDSSYDVKWLQFSLYKNGNLAP